MTLNRAWRRLAEARVQGSALILLFPQRRLSDLDQVDRSELPVLRSTSVSVPANVAHCMGEKMRAETDLRLEIVSGNLPLRGLVFFLRLNDGRNPLALGLHEHGAIATFS